jgi:hypothetical protein
MKKLLLIASIVLLSINLHAQHDLRCLTYGSPDGTQTQYNEIGLFMDNIPVEYNGCSSTPAIIVAVIEPDCEFWNTCDFHVNQLNEFTSLSGNCDDTSSGTGTCRNRVEHYFIFELDDANQMFGLSILLNSVSSNYYILAYTWYTYHYSTVSQFKQMFQNLGATQITNLQDGNPYIFFAQKGVSSSVMELVGTAITDTLELITTVNCTFSSVDDFKQSAVRLYPNPVTSILNFNATVSDWKISDMIGREIKRGTKEKSINVADLPNGLYIIKGTMGNGIFSRVFVK